MNWNRLSDSVADTEAIAAELAAQLKGGECIALEGALGAGKTQFVRGLVRALGGDVRSVSSPTFVLLHVYNTASFQVFHLDAYRLGGADDLAAIGFDELLEQRGVVVIEWASKVENALPINCIHVGIETIGAEQRRLTLTLPCG